MARELRRACRSDGDAAEGHCQDNQHLLRERQSGRLLVKIHKAEFRTKIAQFKPF